jgi:glycosyltransferase involved in cell wall biosynthesis
MKILIFHTYNKSLLTSFFIEFLEHISLNNHSVIWFSLKQKEQIFSRGVIDVIIEKKGNRLSNYLKIFRFIIKEKPDMVISNFSYVNPATFFSYLYGVKHRVIWYHTLKDQMNFKKLNIYIKSIMMRLSSNIVTNSIELKDEVINTYYQPEKKVFNLPFTTNIKVIEEKKIELNRDGSLIYIGCPGRIHEDKNQLLILEALEHIDRSNIRLVFAGGGDIDLIKNHKTYNDFKNQIHFTGTLSIEEMKYFYNQMDIIVLPSLNEAFGLVLIEALSLGAKTLVSWRFGAISYIKEPIDFMTFDPKNPLELANKINDFILKTYSKIIFQKLYSKYFRMDNIVFQFTKSTSS